MFIYRPPPPSSSDSDSDSSDSDSSDSGPPKKGKKVPRVMMLSKYAGLFILFTYNLS